MVCNAAGVGVLPYPLFLRKGALKSCQIVHLEGAEPLVARASLLDKFCGEGGGREGALFPISMDFSPSPSRRRRAGSQGE